MAALYCQGSRVMAQGQVLAGCGGSVQRSEGALSASALVSESRTSFCAAHWSVVPKQPLSISWLTVSGHFVPLLASSAVLDIKPPLPERTRLVSDTFLPGLVGTAANNKIDINLQQIASNVRFWQI